MLALYLEYFDKEDDKSLFSNIYADYEQLIFKIAYRYLNDKNLAEDAVHDTFIEIIKSFEVFKNLEDDKQKSYIGTIAYRCSVKIFNKEIKGKDDINDYEDIIGECDNDFWNQVDFEKLVLSIKNLPVTYREPFIKRYSENLDYKTIAKDLNLTDEAVRKRISRAKEKLRRELTE